MVRITSRFFHFLFAALCCLALCSIALIAEAKPPEKKAPPSPEKKEQGKKADLCCGNYDGGAEADSLTQEKGTT